jgi:hypothetical protein
MLGAIASISCGIACSNPRDRASVYGALIRHFESALKAYVVLETPLDSTSLVAPTDSLVRDFPAHRVNHRQEDFGALPIRLLREAEFHEIFSDTANCTRTWDEFRRRFPESPSLLRLSTICFKRRGAEAHVLSEISSGCMGMTIDRFSFERRGHAWRFAAAENLGRV